MLSIFKFNSKILSSSSNFQIRYCLNTKLCNDLVKPALISTSAVKNANEQIDNRKINSLKVKYQTGFGPF